MGVKLLFEGVAERANGVAVRRVGEGGRIRGWGKGGERGVESILK